MADSLIVNLLAATPLAGTELFVADQAASDVKVTAQQLLDFVHTATPTGSGSSTGNNTGDQVLPTTLPASDVSAWAKAANKPTYTAGEVGAQPAGAYATGSGSAAGVNTGDQTNIPNRVISIASTGTAPVNADTTDLYEITALAAPCVFAAPTGTPVNGQGLMYRVRDVTAIRALSFSAVFAPAGVALPTTTVLGKWMHMAFIYNTTAAKWQLIGLSQEA